MHKCLTKHLTGRKCTAPGYLASLRCCIAGGYHCRLSTDVRAEPLSGGDEFGRPVHEHPREVGSVELVEAHLVKVDVPVADVFASSWPHAVQWAFALCPGLEVCVHLAGACPSIAKTVGSQRAGSAHAFSNSFQ